MLILSIFCLLTTVNCYKILVFSPTTSRSHMISNGRIADTLAEAGHDVTMFEPDFMKIHDKVQPVKLARRWPVYNFSTQFAEAMETFSRDVFEEETIYYYTTTFGAYSKAYNALCKDLINRADVIEQLRAEKFDLYIGEHQNMCGNALGHAVGIKTHFWVSSRSIGEQMSWVAGLPFTHSYVPASFGIDMGTNPTYFERFYNLAMGMSFVLGMKYHNMELTQIFRDKFGADFPDVNSISGNSDLILISTDEFIDINRPILPNLVHIGGLGLKDSTEPLDKTFETEMSKGELGVIYFSLGTIVNTTIIPTFALKTVLDAAKRLPKYHFIVKVDKYDKFAFDYAATIPNVFITGWVSQQPVLLAHPRLRLFITHAGYNGVIEAARAGVPLVTMPFMFDQSKNSRAIATSGWGVALRRQSLRDQPEALGEAVNEIISNEKYKKQALRIRRLIRNKPFNATERLVKWTEFVLSNGGLKELLVEGRNINLVTYYNLDIFVPLILVGFITFYLLLKAVFHICTCKRISQKRKLE